MARFHSPFPRRWDYYGHHRFTRLPSMDEQEATACSREWGERNECHVWTEHAHASGRDRASFEYVDADE